MSGPNIFKLQRDGQDPEQLSAEFPDDENRILMDYLRYCDELRDSKLIREGFSCNLKLNGSLGQQVQVETALPAKDALSALLHRLRPLILQKEKSNFNRAAAILKRRV